MNFNFQAYNFTQTAFVLRTMLSGSIGRYIVHISSFVVNILAALKVYIKQHNMYAAQKILFSLPVKLLVAPKASPKRQTRISLLILER